MRTPAMMAMTHGFAIVHLAMVGGGVGETIDSRHTFKGKHIPVADHPVAQFGEVIQLQYDPNVALVRQAGIATRTILKPDLQQTLDMAYHTRHSLCKLPKGCATNNCTSFDKRAAARAKS